MDKQNGVVAVRPLREFLVRDGGVWDQEMGGWGNWNFGRGIGRWFRIQEE